MHNNNIHPYVYGLNTATQEHFLHTRTFKKPNLILQSKNTTCIVQLKQNTTYLLKKKTHSETKRNPATLSCDTTTDTKDTSEQLQRQQLMKWSDSVLS